MDDLATVGPDVTSDPADRRAFAFGFGRLMVGRVATMGFQFAGLAILARSLGPGDFGLVQFVASLFVYVAFLGDLGLSVVGARDLGRLAREDRQIGELVGARFLLTGITTLVVLALVLLAPLSGRDRTVAILFTAGFAVSAANLRWLLQAREQFAELGAVEVVASFVQLLAVVFLVRGPGDVVRGAAAVVVYPIALSLMSIIAVAPGRSALPRLSLEGLGRIRTSARLGIAVIATAVYYSADTVILGAFRGETEVGYYAAAYKVVLAALMIPVMANTVALPMTARIRAQRPDELREFLATLSGALILVSLPLTVGTVLLAPAITAAVFGEAYMPAATPLALLIVTVVTVSANVPFATLMLAEHRDRAYLAITVAGAAINIGINLIAVPRFGMLGAAVVTVVTEASVLGLILYQTRGISFPIVAASVQAALLPTVVMAAVVWPFRDTLIAAPLGVTAFVLVAAASGTFPIADLWRAIGPGRNRG